MSQVRVGVGCFILNSAGTHFVTGVRIGSHGAGTLQLPGGHLEVGESFSACAAREVLEETGLAVSEAEVHFLTATNDVFPPDASGVSKHYVTIFTVVQLPRGAPEPQVLEPEKCTGWEWHTWAELQQLATSGERELFLPLKDLIAQRPGFDPIAAFAQLSGSTKMP